MLSSLPIHSGRVRSFTVPTDSPEADGTLTWNKTTLVLVELSAGDAHGIGYTYSHKVAGSLAQDLIEQAVLHHDVFSIPAIFQQIRKLQRNYGREGIAATALSAIDIALWDLQAKLLRMPLFQLLGSARASAPVYGSGGFTTYSEEQMQQQLGGWIEEGVSRVKIKIGSEPQKDLSRVCKAREIIGPNAELFVDANGAYTCKQALLFAEQFATQAQVSWFEEPVSSDDLTGLHHVRNNAPAGMEIAAGEYAWDTMNLRRLLAAGAVDVLQADATRCGGISGFMEAAALAEAHPISLSAHCAPSIHMHLACAVHPVRHVEYFHDHVRIEQMLFDGFCVPVEGAMHPDRTRSGLGLEFKESDAEAFCDDL